MAERTLVQKLNELGTRQHDAALAVCIFARTVLPLLKDHGLPSVAAELAEKLFQLDAAEQDLKNLMHQDPRAMLEAMVTVIRER